MTQLYEKKIQEHDLKIQEIGIQLEDLNREVDAFFNVLDINLDRVAAFASNSANFHPEDWDKLVEQRSQLQEKLQRTLDNVRNPKKVKSAYSSLNVPQHWLYVR